MKKIKNILYRLIQIILILVIIYNIYKIADYYYQNYASTKQLNEISEIVNNVEKEITKKEDKKMQLTKEQYDLIAKKTISRLKERNKDIVSYIKAEEFKIDNPVAFKEFDNDYYLYKNIDEQYSRPGTLFMNGWNKTDYSDMNTTIFGHNLRTNPDVYAPMFKLLLKLEDEEFVRKKDEHIVEVYTQTGYKRYKIFAAYYSHELDDYIEPNRDLNEWVKYLNGLRDKSIVNFKVEHDFKKEDKILTLSTCDNVSDEGRFVVHAIELEVK